MWAKSKDGCDLANAQGSLVADDSNDVVVVVPLFTVCLQVAARPTFTGGSGGGMTRARHVSKLGFNTFQSS